jgi:hypothetical protein
MKQIIDVHVDGNYWPRGDIDVRDESDRASRTHLPSPADFESRLAMPWITLSWAEQVSPTEQGKLIAWLYSTSEFGQEGLPEAS